MCTIDPDPGTARGREGDEMTQARTRTPWHHLAVVLVAGGIMGAGSGVVLNDRHGDAVDVSTSSPAPVSGEGGPDRPVFQP